MNEPHQDDYRAEVQVARWLANAEWSLEQLTIRPAGTFRRAYQPDVQHVTTTQTPHGPVVAVQIAREGLYDMLPEGLFHQAERKTTKTAREAAAESQRYSQEEAAARRFFLPLEQEFYRQRIWAEYTELHFWLGDIQAENSDLFLRFWGLPTNLFSARQAAFLLALLPHVHQTAGRPDMAAYCLETLLGDPVRIRPVPLPGHVVPDEACSRVGEMRLGVDCVPGFRWTDDACALEVCIGPVAGSRLLPYLPEGKAHLQLQCLYGYLFSIETEVITAMQIQSEEEQFVLLPAEHTARLGYTTRL